METIIQREIQEIINRLKCPKGYACYTSGFKNLCEVKDIGLESFIACLMEDPLACKSSIRFGGISFCKCQLRIYIAKKLSK